MVNRTRAALAALLFGLVGCGGQIAPENDGARSSESPTQPPRASRPGASRTNPSSGSDSSGGSDSPGRPTDSPPSSCAEGGIPRTFANADEVLASLAQVFWVPCSSTPSPFDCPRGDDTLFFQSEPAAENYFECGHIGPHGQAFIAHAAHKFKFDVTETSPESRDYVLRVWNEREDYVFKITWAHSTGMNVDVLILDDDQGHRSAFRIQPPTTF